ncbi:Ankyrin-1 [Dactylella cylindrospora]|nr:Ankyrin-1 [Dactylella cylindrospora]
MFEYWLDHIDYSKKLADIPFLDLMTAFFGTHVKPGPSFLALMQYISKTSYVKSLYYRVHSRYRKASTKPYFSNWDFRIFLDTPLFILAYRGHDLLLERIWDLENQPFRMRDFNGMTLLHAACLTGQPETTRFLLDKGAEPNFSSGRMDLPIFCAIQSDSVQCLEALLEHGASLSVQDSQGRSPAHVSVLHRSINVFNYLIPKGLKVDEPLPGIGTPIEGLLRNDSLGLIDEEYISVESQILKTLLTAGADVAQPTQSGNTLVQMATKGKFRHLIPILIAAGADADSCGDASRINAYNIYSQSYWYEKGFLTPVEYAAAFGDISTLKALLENGATYVSTAMEYAAFEGRESALDYLMNLKPVFKATLDRLLHLALGGGNMAIAQKLVLQGAELPKITPDLENNTLVFAVRRGSNAAVKFLLQHGYDPNTPDIIWGTALCAATDIGNNACTIIRMLLDAGADANAHRQIAKSRLQELIQKLDEMPPNRVFLSSSGANRFLELVGAPKRCDVPESFWLYPTLSNDETSVIYETPIKRATLNIRPTVAQFLVDAGAWNPITDFPEVFAGAIERDFINDEGVKEKLISSLIETGISLDTPDSNRALREALYAAILWGNSHIVDLLLDAGADVHACDSKLGSAIQLAIEKRNDELLDNFLKRGAEVNRYSGGKYGRLVVAAAAHRRPDIVQRLIDLGADADGTDGVHGTAMGVAARSEHYTIIDLLLASGANINSWGEHYSCPLKSALIGGHWDMMEYLLSRGADIHCACPSFDLSAEEMVKVSAWQETVLQTAAWRLEISPIKMLIDFGADVNFCGPKGRGTALQLAASSPEIRDTNSGRFLDLARILMDAGADIDSPATDELPTVLDSILANTGLQSAEVIESLMEMQDAYRKKN